MIGLQVALRPGVEETPAERDVDVAARDQQVAGAAPGVVEVGGPIADGHAQLLGERGRHDHERQAVAVAVGERRRRVLGARGVVLELELGVLLQRLHQAELRALGPDLVGDVDRQIAAHGIAQREDVVGADRLLRRREQAIGEQRVGRRRRRGGAAGEEGGDDEERRRGNAHGSLPAAAEPPQRHHITKAAALQPGFSRPPVAGFTRLRVPERGRARRRCRRCRRRPRRSCAPRSG